MKHTQWAVASVIALGLVIGKPAPAISQASGSGSYGSQSTAPKSPQGNTTGSTSSTSKLQTYSGAVASIDSNTKKIKLKMDDGQQKEFTLDSSTKFSKSGTQLSDLKVGQKITVTVDTGNKVSWIELAAVTDPPKPSASSSTKPAPSTSSSVTGSMSSGSSSQSSSSSSQSQSSDRTNQGVNPYGPGAAAQSSANPNPGQPPAQSQSGSSMSRSEQQDFIGTVMTVNQTDKTITFRTSNQQLVSSLKAGQQITLWAKESSDAEGLRDPGKSGQTPSRGNEPYGQAKSDQPAERFIGSFVSSDQSTITLRLDSQVALNNLKAGQEVSLLVASASQRPAPSSSQSGSSTSSQSGSSMGGSSMSGSQSGSATQSTTSGSSGVGSVSSTSQPSAKTDQSERFMGTITAVSPATNKITIRTSDGQQKEFMVDYNTRYSLSSAAGSISDLKVGQYITITGTPGKATAIESTTAPTGAGSTPSTTRSK